MTKYDRLFPVDWTSRPFVSAEGFPDIVDCWGQPDQQDVPAPANGDFWVFAYGSLMWRPGFEHLERVPARIAGMHRIMCVYSVLHRGKPARAGSAGGGA